MEKKINVGALREELKATADLCAKSKLAFKEAQRKFSKNAGSWREVNACRSAASDSAMTMTRLCVYRAHLRGLKHLSDTAPLAGYAKQWIQETEDDFLVASAA